MLLYAADVAWKRMCLFFRHMPPFAQSERLYRGRGDVTAENRPGDQPGRFCEAEGAFPRQAYGFIER